MLGYVLRKIKLKSLILATVLLTICFFIIQVVLNFSSHRGELPVILWWTAFMAEPSRIINCNKYSCLLTKNRHYHNHPRLQAYLFYGSMFDQHDLPLPKKHNWAIIHEESPRNSAIFLANKTWDLFEIVSTFSRHSDYPITLQYLHNLSIITDRRYFVRTEIKNKLLPETAPILYLQSDCDTPNNRDNYVKELMKYVKVDSYGACLHNRDFPREISDIYGLDFYNPLLLRFIANYKFTIAFENALCDDYITEKLWRPIIVGSVPIYLGSPTIEDWLPNEKSAILVKNYKSPEELAKFILQVNKNDTLYNEFLTHKDGRVKNRFLVSTLNRGPFGLETEEEHPIPSFECFVCEQIHKGGFTKRTKQVYNCPKPDDGNAWSSFWKLGKCQAEALLKIAWTSDNVDDTHCKQNA